MPRKATTALAAVLFFGAVPAVLADASNKTDHHGLSTQRPVSITSNGRTGVVNDVEKPFSTEKNASFAASQLALAQRDRKSTRLNSSHSQISYAVFCLKKKKTHQTRV